MNDNTMKLSLFFTILISLVSSAAFYWSMGGSPLESTIYMCTGLVILSIVLFMPHIILASWHNSHPIRAGLFSLLLMICFFMQLFAGYGFFAKSQEHLEQNKAINSIGYTAAKARLDAANAKLEAMSSNAGVDVAGLTTKAETLNSKLLAARTELAKCNKGWYGKCINPAKAKIENLESQLAKVESQMGSGQGYQGVLAERQAALNDLQKIAESKGVSTNNINAVFVMTERLTGIPARDVQAGTTLAIPVIVEFWILGCAYLVTVGLGDYQRDLGESHIPQTALKNITPEPEKLAAAPAPIESKTELPKKSIHAGAGFSPVKISWNESIQPAIKKA